MTEAAGRRLLVVGRTWDGAIVGPAERAVVELAGAGDDLVVRVEAPFHGDPLPAGAPGATPRLWEHEVVELFVAGEGEPVPYLEVELGPGGHHLVLRLAGVRRRVEEGLALDYRAAIEGARWRGEARVPRCWLPPPPHRVNAFAIHGTAGAGRRYLAMEPLPGTAPDFHQPARFPPLVLP
ncbi:MAG TPA: hypothetical protein VHQ65_02685 [Thermoanaerobaculia bacterium]|nr:hypothetical protein [Thermoanaerobaculia bacterium]